MRLLLDTHTLIWAQDDSSKLGTVARTELQITANELVVSMATVWEMSIKIGLGKLALSQPFRVWIERAISDLDLIILPVTLSHADQQSRLPWHHRDPFDRMLASQSLVEGIPLVSADVAFDAYGVTRFWN